MKSIVTCFLIIFCVDACGLVGGLFGNPIDDVLASFDQAIADITNQSIAWQSTLTNLEDKINKDVNTTINGSLRNLIGSSVAIAGVELRCNADFARQGIKKELRRLKLKYLLSVGRSSNEAFDEYTPQICQTVPASVDVSLNPNSVTFTGWDLSKNVLKAKLITTTGEVDITDKLNHTSNYENTILIGGSNGLKINHKQKNIVLYVNDESQTLLSEVGINIPPFQIKYGSFHGGGGGAGFVDAPSSNVKRLKHVVIRGGQYVDAIYMAWEMNDGSTVATGWHGNPNGGGAQQLELAPDEFITRVVGSSGNYMDALGFRTNKGRQIYVGGSGGGGWDENLFPNGDYEVIGMEGGSGVYLDRIRFIYRERDVD